MTTLVTILVVIAGLYGFLFVFARLHADDVVFQPPPSSYRDLAGMLRIPAPDGTLLAAVHRVAAAAPYTVFYLHGNAEDLGDIDEHLSAIHARGFSVLSFDYRGYGLNPGRPTEVNVHADTAAVFRHLVEKLRVPPSRVILYGRSLGSGPAFELALREPIAGMILEGAFTSAFRVVTRVRLLPNDRFCNLEKLPRVRCPLLFIHATADRTVPFSHGRRLFAAAPPPKQKLWVQGAGHNNLRAVAGERYWAAWTEFVRTLPR